jgi:multiple sugar transport system ATP-binding protein
MARLILQHLTKVYPGAEKVRAVHDLTLATERGELLVLLGPSGCGKTTTLRLIAGLETPSSGRIFLGGEAIDGKPARDRHVAVAFQYPALLPQLNVFRNLTLGLTLRGLDAHDATQKIQRVADVLAVTPLMSRMPETLSGGQQQRVALARAMVLEPRLFLLDEPLASLDPITRSELRTAIREIQQEFRTTTVYVTHDQAEAVAMGDRIAIMNFGRLEQIGTAAELYQKPANLFVARFFGPSEINLVLGALAGECFVRDELRVPAPGLNLARKDVFLGFRPSEIVADPHGPLVGKVAAVEHHGWTRFVRLAIGAVHVRMEQRSDEPLNGQVRLSIRSHFLFDSETGARVG